MFPLHTWRSCVTPVSPPQRKSHTPRSDGCQLLAGTKEELLAWLRLPTWRPQYVAQLGQAMKGPGLTTVACPKQGHQLATGGMHTRALGCAVQPQEIDGPLWAATQRHGPCSPQRPPIKFSHPLTAKGLPSTVPTTPSQGLGLQQHDLAAWPSKQFNFQVFFQINKTEDSPQPSSWPCPVREGVTEGQGTASPALHGPLSHGPARSLHCGHSRAIIVSSVSSQLQAAGTPAVHTVKKPTRCKCDSSYDYHHHRETLFGGQCCHYMVPQPGTCLLSPGHCSGSGT